MSVIVKTDLEFVREKLKSPFGFKGRYLDELWQTVALVATERHTAVAPATESVLWSDGAVFGENPPAAANALMMTVTARALRLLEGRELVRPDLMLDALLPSLEDYAEAVCGRRVAPTFVLNALVGVDIALWSLYARENGIDSFDGIVPPYAKAAMAHRHAQLSHIPLISYAVGEKELRACLDSFAARMAAVRRSSKALSELQRHIRLSEDAGYLEHYRADVAFHRAIYYAAGNSYLTDIYEHISFDLSRVKSYITGGDLMPEDKRQIIAEHTAIFEAIKNRNGKEAFLLSQRHAKMVLTGTVSCAFEHNEGG